MLLPTDSRSKVVGWYGQCSWVLCLLAQHYNRRRLTDKALALIDEAIEHTPTIVDFYSVKALIYKRAGSHCAPLRHGANNLHRTVRCIDRQ